MLTGCRNAIRQAGRLGNYAAGLRPDAKLTMA